MQEVFEKIIEKLEEIRVKKTCNTEKCNTKELCRIRVVDDAIEIVKQAAAEYKNVWIPCSERLPDNDKKEYIVQKTNGFIYILGFTIWCECSKCYAKTEGYCPNIEKEDSSLVNIEECKNKAIELWNRRA